MNYNNKKKLGQSIAKILLLKSDKIGFYRTELGMKTSQGIGDLICDEIEKLELSESDCAAPEGLAGSKEETK